MWKSLACLLCKLFLSLPVSVLGTNLCVEKYRVLWRFLRSIGNYVRYCQFIVTWWNEGYWRHSYVAPSQRKIEYEKNASLVFSRKRKRKINSSHSSSWYFYKVNEKKLEIFKLELMLTLRNAHGNVWVWASTTYLDEWQSQSLGQANKIQSPLSDENAL